MAFKFHYILECEVVAMTHLATLEEKQTPGSKDVRALY